MSAAQIRSARDHALFTVALGAGLTASRIKPLSLGHVTRDGSTVRPAIDLSWLPGRLRPANDNGLRVALPPPVRVVLGKYIAGLKAQCAHFDRPMLTKADERGIVRCASCGLAANVLELPLFSSRLRERLSVRRMRSLFAEYRDQVRLPPHFHFDSLKATFEAGHVIDLGDPQARLSGARG